MGVRTRVIKTATVVIGPRVYLVVSDLTAGKRNRFTVHRVSLVSTKRAEVVGRSLTKGESERLIRRLERPVRPLPKARVVR